MRNTFNERLSQLRLDAIAYIKDYLVKVNRSIVVGHNALSYVDWDYATSSDDYDEMQVVPEIEISMISLVEKGEVGFINAKGDLIFPTDLDTEELLYVVDYIDSLVEEAPGTEVK